MPVMKKMDRTLLYKVIAGVSFVVLCLTQLLHIRTMYNMESRNYYEAEKKKIKSDYEQSITNDKLFPGGTVIIDRFFYQHLDSLEQLAQTSPEIYKAYARTVQDSMFIALKSANNLDSLLTRIETTNKIGNNLNYALIIHSIDLAFRPNVYVPFYNGADPAQNPVVPTILHLGAKVGGTLENVNTDNQVSSLIVSTPIGHSYRIKFSLHVDSPDRFQHIVLRMLPTISVSMVSILAVLVIFVLTLINWQKQKKISEAKADFINTITHEFQTPLSAIIIANKTIENENQHLVNERLSFLNGVIRRQTERLDLLIKQVAGSNTDQGIALSLLPYRVNHLLDELIADYRINLQGKNTSIFFTCRAASDEVLLDKPHFTSIVTNLLDNAVKYNHKPMKEIHLSTSKANEKTLVLTVQDNGDGMSEKVRKQIFTRFYRDPSLTRSNEPGLGLGLYFMKQSLSAHHWKCEVRSKEGLGSEFLISMPLLVSQRKPVIHPNRQNNAV